MPWLALSLVNLAALGIGAWRLSQGSGSWSVVGINLGWALYNLAILAATAAVAWEKRQVRERHRIPLRLRTEAAAAPRRTSARDREHA